MTDLLASALVLAACIAGLILGRRKRSLVQFGIDFASLAALSLALWHDNENPLLTPATPPGT